MNHSVSLSQHEICETNNEKACREKSDTYDCTKCRPAQNKCIHKVFFSAFVFAIWWPTNALGLVQARHPNPKGKTEGTGEKANKGSQEHYREALAERPMQKSNQPRFKKLPAANHDLPPIGRFLVWSSERKGTK
jgi:hypothetical protein